MKIVPDQSSSVTRKKIGFQSIDLQFRIAHSVELDKIDLTTSACICIDYSQITRPNFRKSLHIPQEKLTISRSNICRTLTCQKTQRFISSTNLLADLH